MDGAREITTKSRASKYDTLKRAVKKYLKKDMNIAELQEKTAELEVTEPEPESVAIGSLSLQDVEKCLKLKFDKRDKELKNVEPLPLPSGLGI